MVHSGGSRGGRALVTALTLVVGVALAGCTGPPREEVGPLVREYARAWSDRDPRALGELTDAPREATAAVTDYQRALGTWDTAVRPVGEPSCGFGGCEQRFRVLQQVPGVGPWRYSTTVNLVSVDGAWRVGWAPANYHPRLADGDELRLRPGTPTERTSATLLTVDEQPLASTAQIPGPVRRLADRSGSVELVSADGESETLYRPERTDHQIALTVSAAAQSAAEAALADVGGDGTLVAVRASTGEVLAAVGDGALNGRYEPGSVFGVVSAAALIDRGLDTAEPVSCPDEATAGGTAFRNPGGSSRESAPFWEALIWSCDTTIVGRSGSLRPGDLPETARKFGIGAGWDLGVPAYSGRVSDGSTKNGKDGEDGEIDRARIAASAIGREGVTLSPLAMAGVAGTVATGQAVAPSVLLQKPAAGEDAAAGDEPTDGEDATDGGEATERSAAPAPGEGVLTRLRGLLRAGVTDGPAAPLRESGEAAGDPGAQVYALAGRTLDQQQEWVIGYRGDLAFAVMAPRDSVGTADRFLDGYP